LKALALRRFRAHRCSSSRKEQCDWFDNQTMEQDQYNNTS